MALIWEKLRESSITISLQNLEICRGNHIYILCANLYPRELLVQMDKGWHLIECISISGWVIEGMKHLLSHDQQTYAPLYWKNLKRISNWWLLKSRMPEKGGNESSEYTYCTKSVCPRTEMSYSSKKFSWCSFLLYRKRCGVTFPDLKKATKKTLEHKKINKRHKLYGCQIQQVLGLTV